MNSLHRIGLRPVSLPLAADDIVEFHAARLLLLIRFCGKSNRIDGLTKLAKLDFFVRYPDFFEVAQRHQSLQQEQKARSKNEIVESAMVRHHYGPWDKRYYHVLAYLEAKTLITVIKEGNSYKISLTKLGEQKANSLALKPSYVPIVDRMKQIKDVFGSKTGNAIKKLIYEIFEEEVGHRALGEMIKQ